jgi:DNA-binding FrmR family transcriptional regulator
MATKPRANDGADTPGGPGDDAAGAPAAHVPGGPGPHLTDGPDTHPPDGAGEPHVDGAGAVYGAATTAPHGPHGYSGQREQYLARLRRIEGQIRGLQRMVAEDQYCIDILTQVSAATRALQSVALGLLEDHLGHCVADAAAAGGPVAQERLREASAAIARLVRS